MKPKLRSVGCFVEYDNTFTILLRNKGKSQGRTWGLPGGKVEPGETDSQAIAREVYEETGIQAKPEAFEALGIFVFNFPNIEVTFPTFRLMLQQQPTIVLEPDAHHDYRWVTAQECYAMPHASLIHGFHELLEKLNYIER
ncbi:MAG TPA: NUDIX hydrolase [Nevskiaceae bacterium]|nr:NUDIX hydrolase [Nevskiaceae bacterium]